MISHLGNDFPFRAKQKALRYIQKTREQEGPLTCKQFDCCFILKITGGLADTTHLPSVSLFLLASGKWFCFHLFGYKYEQSLPKHVSRSVVKTDEAN